MTDSHKVIRRDGIIEPDEETRLIAIEMRTATDRKIQKPDIQPQVNGFSRLVDQNPDRYDEITRVLASSGGFYFENGKKVKVKLGDE